MSRALFSKPDVNNVMSSSHVFKSRLSLNQLSKRRLPESRGKHLFGIVVIALLVLSLQLTACGSAVTSNNGSASQTPDTTSPSNIPTPTSTSTGGSGSTSASTSTTGPTNNPTTGSTTGSTTGPNTGPAPDPTSFSISVKGGTFCYTATAGQSDHVKTLDYPSDLTLIYNDSAKPAPGPINWTVSKLGVPANELGNLSCSDSFTCTKSSGNWLSINPSSGSIAYRSPQVPIALDVLHGASMQAGVYCIKIQFKPVNSDQDFAYAVFIVSPASSGPTISSINPTSGPAAGGTTVTIKGTGFVVGSTSVSFGGVAASRVSVDSDTQITATSPAGSGTVNVTVTTPNGNVSAQFKYT